jgi:2-oxoglutarate dehydrogenase E1 component
VERGTFSHRHAVVKTDEDQEKEFITLNMISDKQAPLTIYNSLLSEYGVLGFDYGYAFGSPQGLTIWEAQFGDFNNGAQIMIDQFISAAEDKWRTMNGTVMKDKEVSIVQVVWNASFNCVLSTTCKFAIAQLRQICSIY